VRYDPENKYTKHTALQGLRAVQVRMIFELPLQAFQGASQVNVMPVQLAYIEWFKPFRLHDPLTGMFILSCATQSGIPLAEVVPLERLVGSVHLSPCLGTHADP
jgi:hypothetical protein